MNQEELSDDETAPSAGRQGEKQEGKNAPPTGKHLHNPLPSGTAEGEDDLVEGKGFEDAPTNGDEGGGNLFGDGISTEPNEAR